MASSRFAVQDGEIVDLQTRQIISPDHFNSLATPEDRDRVEEQLGGAGLLESGPSEQEGLDETDPLTQRNLPSESAAPSNSRPSLDEFMTAAREDNPGVPDRTLRQHWAKNYNDIDPKTLPPLDTFMKDAQADNPGVPTHKLRQHWDEHYGDFGAARETPPASSVIRRAGDVPIGLAKGIVDLPKAALGLADIATGGYAGEGATAILDAMGSASDAVGLPAWARPSQWSDQLRNLYSKETKANLSAVGEKAKAAESEAKDSGSGPFGQIAASAGGAIKGLVENPGAIIPLAAENYGGMKAIAMGTAKLLGPLSKSLNAQVIDGTMDAVEANKILGQAAIKYAAAGEGVLTSGQVSSGISQEDPAADFAHRLAAVIAGATTAGITRGAAKIPGLGDVEASMATKSLGKNTGFQGSLPARVGKGAISEGVTQELPQSAQEQALQNIGASKPWQEGVGEQAIEGMAAGGTLGGGMAGLHGARPGSSPTAQPEETPAPTVDDIMAAPDVDTAIAHMEAMVSAPGSASGERVTDPGLSQDPDIARLRRQIERGGATGPVGSALGPNLGMSEAEPNALNNLIERGGALPNQAELTQAAERTRQPFEAPLLSGPGPQADPTIEPGQAFNPRQAPEADPRAALQAERNRLIARRDSAIKARGTAEAPLEVPIEQPDVALQTAAEKAAYQQVEKRPSQAPPTVLPASTDVADEAPQYEPLGGPLTPQQEMDLDATIARDRAEAQKEYDFIEPSTIIDVPSTNTVTSQDRLSIERKKTAYKLNPVENVPTPVPDNPSVQDLHALAAQKGFNVDGMVFHELTKMVTGTAKLDNLTPQQRQKFASTLQKIPEKAYSSPVAKPKAKTQPMDLPTGQTATETLPVSEAAQVPRSQLVPEQNAEMLARAEKAQADLEIAGNERGGRYFSETQGKGGDQEITGLKSATADWYKDATSGPQALSRKRVDVAVEKILRNKGRDVGKDVQRIKELLLLDNEFRKSPFAPKTDADWKALIAEATHQPLPSQPASVDLQTSPAELPSPAVQDEEPSPEAAPTPTPIQAEKARLQKKPQAEKPSENYRMLPQKTRDKFEAAWTGSEQADRPSIRTLKEWIDPGNKTLRAEFERRSGVKLPKGLAATNAAVEEYFKKPIAPQAETKEAIPETKPAQEETKAAVDETPGEPFSLSSKEPSKPKTKGPEQLGIDIPAPTIGEAPIIGREVDTATAETEAPLFSKAAQTENAEQADILESGSAKEPWQMTREEFGKAFPAVKQFQEYTSDQRANRAASFRLGPSQKQSLGETFWTHAQADSIAYPTATAAVDAAYRNVTEQHRVTTAPEAPTTILANALQWNVGDAVIAKIGKPFKPGTIAGDRRSPKVGPATYPVRLDNGNTLQVPESLLARPTVQQPEPTQAPQEPMAILAGALRSAADQIDGNKKPAPKTDTAMTGLEDAGQKIGGSRKDRWAQRGLTLADLEGMTGGEEAKFIVKANIWKPNYAEMVKAGTEPKAAALVKIIYDRLAAKPEKDTPESRRDYLAMMGHVKQAYAAVKAVEDLKQARQDITKWWDRSEDGKQGIAFSVYKGRTDPFYTGYSEGKKANKMVAEGFPNQEPWTRRYDITAIEARGMTNEGANFYAARMAELDKSGNVEELAATIKQVGAYEIREKNGRIVSYRLDRQSAEEQAQRLYENKSETKEDGKDPVRPHLDELSREGQDYRNGKDVTAEDFRVAFGFRGIEFGGYAASDERQKHVNQAYDALRDLADLLGIPQNAISLNGTLGLAFGSRGGGKAVAHYEPSKLVINITKINGPGALAHEWGHALDHYFGELDRPDAYKGKAKGASGWDTMGRYTGPSTRLGNLRPEMAQAFDKVMSALFQRNVTKAEAVRAAELKLEKLKKGVADHVNSNLKDLRESLKMQEEAAGRHLAKLTEEDRPEGGYGKVDTSYYKAAETLSGPTGTYWTRPTEMFARSFEAYVFDRLEGKSDYLVHGVEEDKFTKEKGYKANPYPAGVDRPAINAAFNQLFDTMQSKETDQGMALYQRDIHEDPPADEAQTVQSAIEDKSLIEAAQFIADSAPSPDQRLIGERIVTQLTRLQDAGLGFELHIAHHGDLVPDSFVNNRGQTIRTYGSPTTAVWLQGADMRGYVGTSYETVIHELVHAVTQTAIYVGKQEMAVGTELATHVNELNAVFDAVQEHFAQRFESTPDDQLSRFEQAVKRKLNNVQLNSDELLAWTMSNRHVQHYLENIPYKETTLWGRFVEAIRKLLGLAPTANTALSEVLRVSDTLLSADASQIVTMGHALGYPGTINQHEGLLNINIARGEGVPGPTLKNRPRGMVRNEGLVNNQQAMAAPEPSATGTGTIEPNTAREHLSAAKTSARPYLLGALGLQQIADVYGRDHAEVADYNTALQTMQADFVQTTQTSDKILKDWDKLKVPVADQMAKVMEDARFANFDPDPVKQQAALTPAHRDLQARFKAMPDDAKAVYRAARDYYTALAQSRFDAIKDRINRSGGSLDNRRALIDRLQLAYEKTKAKVYFPFTRFGDHIVVAKKMEADKFSGKMKESDREVQAFNSPADAARFAMQMKARGWTVKQTTSKQYSLDRDGGASKAVREILDIVDSLPGGEHLPGLFSNTAQLKDAINQTFLNSMPDMSYAKHFIHAKEVKGASRDALRSFAHSALHGAHHISRIRYADRLSNAVMALDERINETDEGDVTEARQVYNELVQRHNTILNPNTHPFSAWLGQLGFTMSLGGVVATGVTNLTQVPLITLPWMGSRYGFGKSTAALATAYKDFLDPATLNKDSLFDASKSARLTAPERAMLEALQKRGRIDLTQTMDLSGRASQDNLSRVAKQTGSIQAKITQMLGFTFHAPEVANRQVTALATYRLARESGATEAAAITKAEESIVQTHFIYESPNRARYMSGNVLRVLTLFKQYSQNIAFLYGRTASIWLDSNNATPEERKIAKKQLLSMASLQFAAAGALGMPFIGTVASLFTAVLNGFGDDDDKWDWEVELRKFLADQLGKEAGEVLSHGVSRLTPWDMAGRLGQADLFFRAPNREREGRAAAMDWVTSFAGPVLGYAVNGYLGVSDLTKGITHLDRGSFLRGTEELVPSVLRNAVKALRFELEGGVRTRDGYKQLETNGLEKIGQFFGFSGSRASELYESVTAVRNKEHGITVRRKELLDGYAAAIRDKDKDARADVMAEIRSFNSRNPAMRISGDSLLRSMKGRERRTRETKGGLYLPKKRESLRQEGDFANY